MAAEILTLAGVGGFLYHTLSKQKSNKNRDTLLSVPEKNYPVENNIVPESDPNKYNNPNQNTDKYFIPNNTNTNEKNMQSLSGNELTSEEFTHNNMVPYFGGRIKGATVDANSAEGRLDHLQGAGSQMFNKTEQAPLFQPHKNLQYASGAPNMTDFMTSRVNPSNRMANVKPWEEKQVPPGLNKGYTDESGPGFNSGVDARELWMPKDVNELRVETNPKNSYNLSGLEGPALAPVLNSSDKTQQGKVEKYLPDRDYEVGPGRWFTTTGAESAPTYRGEEMLQDVNRTETSREYYGTTVEGTAGYSSSEYEQPKRHTLDPTPVANISAKGRSDPNKEDYGVKGHVARANNRSTTDTNTKYGGIYGMVKAAIAPVLDILRPSRKENVIGNLRSTGNVGVPISRPPVIDPNDNVKTTIKEMTVGKLDCNHLNVENQNATGYLVTDHQPTDVQRDTTNISYLGNAMPGDHASTMSYESAYMQRNNCNKTQINHPNQGGTQIFNQNDNVLIKKYEPSINDPCMLASSGIVHEIPSVNTYGKMRVPNHCEPENMDRLNPDLLSAFKSNPYTQSLNSCV